MIKKTLSIVVATAMTAGVSFADWTLVDDMNYADQAAMDAVWSQAPVDASGDPPTPDNAEGAEGGAVLAEVDGNKVLQMNSGAADAVKDTTYNARAVRSIPEISDMGTVYFKINVPTVDVGGTQLKAVVDSVWGLSALSPIQDTENPAVGEVTGAYGDYSVIGRVEFDNSLDFYDNGNPDGAYQTVLVDGPDADEWYQIWYVCDHANNQYKVYIQGGSEFPDQTLVGPEGVDTYAPIGWYAERSPSLETLKSFLIYSSAGSATVPKGLDYMYIDDIYVDTTGENLSVPTGNEMPAGDAEFFNIATRGFVGTGGDIIIGGFVVKGVEGTTTGTVLVRAIGPGLAALGVEGTLVDPVLEIYTAGADPVLVYENDDWGTGPNSDAAAITAASTAVGAFAIPDGSADAVLLLSLAPGGYTAQVSGKDGGTGVAIIEVYAVD